jgi:hypothetical protein
MAGKSWLRTALLVPITVAISVAGSASVAHGQQPHLKPADVSPIPLESLAQTHADNVTVIPPGNSASSNGTPITHGLQFSESSSVQIGLSQYVELDGTLYGDDNGNSGTATFTIYDASSGSDGQPIFKYTFTTGREIIPINISVRGLRAISLETTYGDGSLIDLVATVAGTGNVAPFPPSPLGSTPPIESLPLASTNNAAAIPPGNSANSNGTPITHGLQFSESASAQVALGRAYTSVSGTFYGDDNGNSGSATVTIYDESTGSDGQLLYKYTFATSKDIVPFTISVRGLKAISIETTYGNGSLIDLVATVTRAPQSPPTPRPTVAPRKTTRPSHHAPPKRHTSPNKHYVPPTKHH